MEQRLFATTAKGVEPVLAGELRALGMRGVAEETGGVRFSGYMEAAYRANLWLRTANRVLLPLFEFHAPSEDALYTGVRRHDWRAHLTPQMTFAIDANVRDSKITHSKYAALKAKDAIVDQLRERLGARPGIDTKDPDLRINIHIHHDRCTVSLDTSGESLNKRGYRVARVEAPLRETLAAAIVAFTGWDGTTTLIDPMCGSGTILIEAALMAANIAPGLIRKHFGFQRWIGFDRRLWESLLAEACAERGDTIAGRILGYDASATAIEAARANVVAAGVDDCIALTRRDIRELAPPPGPGVIIVNPPYGERLGEKKELEPLYKAIGDTFKRRAAGYTAYVFTGNPDLAKRIGLKTSRRIVLFNGPIESRLLEYKLY